MQGKKSHLLQMRGLKQNNDIVFIRFERSHLLQMRGLKQRRRSEGRTYQCRIFYRCVDWNPILVLSFHSHNRRIFYRCVDWNNGGGLKGLVELVASFTDAWIETWQLSAWPWKILSHLLQMRGLKLPLLMRLSRNISRIFYRCVDWNLLHVFIILPCLVASFTDAWIETPPMGVPSCWKKVASFTDAWIETSFHPHRHSKKVSHLLQMRGLKQNVTLLHLRR